MSFSTRSVAFIKSKVANTELILKNYAGIVETEAKTNAKWTDRTSHARQSLHSGVEGHGRNFTLFLAHGMKYGRFLEEGTPPHIIRPKNKKALFWHGASHPVRQVNHPGTKPYPILEDTLKSNVNKIKRDLLSEWERSKL